MNEIILKLNDERAVLAQVGGKGASLARLIGAGLPVPPGFHITTAAYNAFVEENRLTEKILDSLSGLKPDEPSTLETASAHIQALFNSARIPTEIENTICNAYLELAPHGEAVAVRSSATAEDLPGHSFAGQQDTYLNICTQEAFLKAVLNCWASLWTARAIGYRLRQEISIERISLAVVVQLLVNAEAAGVLFTVDPLSGRRDHMLINAAWGLGEAVVSGLVTPDSLVVEKSSGRLIHFQTAEKLQMTVRLPEGHTAEQPVPVNMQKRATLDPKQAAALADLGLRIEKLYDSPQDIEWALADGQFFILQARPITTLSSFNIPQPADWPLPRAKASYTRASIIDYMPDPLTPLFSSMGIPIYNQSMKKMIVELFGIEKGFESGLVTLQDYAYFTYEFRAAAMLLLIIRMIAILPRLLRTAAPRLRQQALPEYRAVVKQWQSTPLQDLDSRRLLQGAEAIFQQTCAYLVHIQTGSLGVAMFSESLFNFYYDHFVRRPQDPPAVKFLLGHDSLPIQAEKALFDLAQHTLETPVLAEYLLTTRLDDLLQTWRARQIPADVNETEWQAWRTQFDAYLTQFGYHIYDLDFARSLPQDEPLPLFNTLRLYLQGQGQNPYTRQQKAIEERQEAAAAIRKRLGWLRRRIFDRRLSFASNNVTLREDSIAGIGLGYPQLRALLLELGERLVQAGAITQAADIFWLQHEEARECAAALDEGHRLTSLHEPVRQRKALWQAEKNITPPPVLPLKGKLLGMDAEKWTSARVDDGGSTLQGVPASPGLIEATACVLHGPDEFGKMKAGDVLVASITTPAWTPLFALASAVVTDIGGPLSHGSIVAREYGIPAVLGTGSATRRIQDGQSIRVDGNTGTVTL